MFIILFISIILIFLYLKKTLNYWNLRNVINSQPKTPLGDFINCIYNRENVFTLLKNMHVKYKKEGHRYFGFYFTTGPAFVPIEMKLIKRILITDYDYFNERGAYVDKIKVPLSDNIFCVDGKRWKYLREMINATLTLTRIKNMVNIVDNYANIFVDVIAKYDDKPVDVYDLSLRYTVDVACNVFVGADEECLAKGTSPIISFAHTGNNCSLMNVFKVWLTAGIKKPANLFMSLIIDNKIKDFFYEYVKKVQEMRMQENMNRLDAFADFTKQLENKDVDFDFGSFVGQILVLFGGTFETSSSALTYALYELGKSKNYQERLREEIINTAASNNDLTHDSIMQMKFLDHFITETLRYHPILPIIFRSCVKDYKVPDSDLILEKDISVLISVYAIHNDPEIFPKPEVFDPDRFKDSNQQKAMMTFSLGQKSCPGKQLGLLILKMALIKIVSNFEISINEKTGEPLKSVLFSRNLLWKYENKIWLNFKKI